MPFMDRTLSDRIFPPVLLLLALAWLLPWMPAHAEAPAEWVALPLSERVVDATHTLDEATRQRLVEKLEALERRRGAQIAVVMLPTTGTLDIEAFSDKLFQAWKLGRKAVDDGLLLVVAKDDRRMRIEVGYGLEGAVPDVVAGRIIRERMAPAFREGDYAGGIEAAVDELIRLVDGETLPAAASSGAPKVSLGQLPAEAWALLVAFIYGSLAGVLLSARALRWPWLLGGALLCWLLGTLAGASGEWMSVLLVAPLCMLVGGATFGALWTVRPAFYLVIGVLVYVALLGLAAHWFSAVSFIYGLLWPAGVLMLAVLCWSNYRLMRSLWRERRKSFHRRLWALLAAYLLLGLLSGGLDAPLVWLALLPLQLMLGLLVFGQVRLSGGVEARREAPAAVPPPLPPRRPAAFPGAVVPAAEAVPRAVGNGFPFISFGDKDVCNHALSCHASPVRHAALRRRDSLRCHRDGAGHRRGGSVRCRGGGRGGIGGRRRGRGSARCGLRVRGGSGAGAAGDRPYRDPRRRRACPPGSFAGRAGGPEGCPGSDPDGAQHLSGQHRGLCDAGLRGVEAGAQGDR